MYNDDTDDDLMGLVLLQGTAKAACTFYLWDCTVKLVISDFDGTITRYNFYTFV